MRFKIENGHAKPIVKRMFWLAWKACGGPLGMGWLQNKPDATENDVWENAQTRGDYFGVAEEKPGKAYGDYVFGRMMKLYVEYSMDEVEVPDSPPRPDYQAWSLTYTTYRNLLESAACEMGAKLRELVKQAS